MVTEVTRGKNDVVSAEMLSTRVVKYKERQKKVLKIRRHIETGINDGGVMFHMSLTSATKPKQYTVYGETWNLIEHIVSILSFDA